MNIQKNIHIPGSNGRIMLTDIFFVKDHKRKPLVIFVHGFKGFKDWGHFDRVGEEFAKAGFVFIKFNFSHNGTTIEDPWNFSDLEAFGNNNFILELNDLQIVIDFWQKESSSDSINIKELREQIDRNKIYLLGHSRGGGITILKAGEDTRVKKIATWASVSAFVGRHKQRTIDTCEKEGVVYAMNGRTKQNMPMYYQFYKTILENKERLNINHAVKRLEIPFLIVHGTNDEAVPFHDAEELRMSARKGELLKIEGGDHTFGIKHPFDGVLTSDAKKVIEETIHFFRRE